MRLIDAEEAAEKLEDMSDGTTVGDIKALAACKTVPAIQIDRIKQLREEMVKSKCYRGLTGNPAIDSHNIGLDLYFDKGLDKALDLLDNMIKEYSE